MISKKRYLKALEVVREYERQLTSKVNKTFTEQDLNVMSGAIAVPSLTEDIVNEDYAAKIEDGMVQKGHNIYYVSLNDMGYICVCFYSRYPITIEQYHIDDLLSVLNSK
jgi:hypothetical protein